MRELGDVDVVDVGFISDAQEGAAAAERLRAAGCDLIVGFLTTYMTASMLVPVAQRSGAPVLLINLQPTERMDHADASTPARGWPTAAPARCRRWPTPSSAPASRSARCPGYLEDERAWAADRPLGARGRRARRRCGTAGTA